MLKYLLGLSLASTVVAANLGIGTNSVLIVLSNASALLSAPTNVGTIRTAGYYTPGDGGGDFFTWSPNSTQTTNHGNVWNLSTGGTGRWIGATNAEINVRRFGAKGDASTDDSSRIQAAIDYVKTSLGGGVVRFPATGVATVYNVDAPIIVPAKVSIIIEGNVKVKKTTSTASAIAAAAGSPNYTTNSIGNPICVFHLVERIAGVSYHYSDAQFICNGTIEGDTSDPNTTAVTYGVFAHGLTQAEVAFNGTIANTKYGFVQYGDSIVSSHVHGRIQRVFGGFYCHFGTLVNLSGLYVSSFRDFGQFYNSFLYSHVQNVASEYGAVRSLFPTTTVNGLPTSPYNIGGAVAYVINSCEGSTFKLGSELHNGTGIVQRGNKGCTVESLFLSLFSDYTGSLRVAANYMTGNFDHRSVGNRWEFETPLIGAAVATNHWNYLIDSFYGRFSMVDNRYINSDVSVAESGEGWVYVSGENGQGIVFAPGASIPRVIGGGSTNQDLTFQTTTGDGATGADMHFLVGTNGATEAMTILNSGNVGIGTTIPDSPLHVLGVIHGALDLELGMGRFFGFNTYYNAGYKYRINGFANLIDSDSGDYAFYTSPSGTAGNALTLSDRLHIKNTGNVGIGEAAPGSKLSVSGGGSFGSGYDTTAAPTGGLIIEGNVGIGIVTPTNTLDIQGHTSLRSNLWAFNLGTNGTVVSLLGRDTNSKIVETAMPSGGSGGIATNAGTGFDNTLTNTTLRGIVKVLTNSAGVVALAVNTNNARSALDVIGAVTINPSYDAQSLDPPIIPFLLDANVPGWLQSNRLIDARTNGVSVFAVTSEGKTYQRGISIGVGTNLVVLTNMLYAAATLDFPSTLAQTDSDLAITVTGAKTGDLVTVGGPIPLTGSIFSGFASNDTVFVRCSVYGITAKDPASAGFKVKVEQFQ